MRVEGSQVSEMFYPSQEGDSPQERQMLYTASLTSCKGDRETKGFQKKVTAKSSCLYLKDNRGLKQVIFF